MKSFKSSRNTQLGASALEYIIVLTALFLVIFIGISQIGIFSKSNLDLATEAFNQK